MAENVQVSYYDLSRLNSLVTATLGAVNTLQNQTNQVQNQVNSVSRRVDRIDNELLHLWGEFREFVKVQANRHNVDIALAKITHVRQELESKFSKHADARVRLRGILENADSGLLRENTIEFCSEQILLDTPKYWLAPCLVALAAWISNNQGLATTALEAALKRDAEKTTLLLALICRKTVFVAADEKDDPEKKKMLEEAKDERQKACLKWLSQYFQLQDPMKMKASVIVLVDAWRCEVFGDLESVENKSIKSIFKKWMKDIREADKNFDAEQKAHWKAFFEAGSQIKSAAEECKALKDLCPEFNSADEYVSRIRISSVYQWYFNKILTATIDTSNFIERLDDQLEILITDFDSEEEALRKTEEFYTLVEQNKGDMKVVDQIEAATAKKRLDQEVSFAQRLEDSVKSIDKDDANEYKHMAARKTAISKEFLGGYIEDAYNEFIVEKKDAFPQEITLKHSKFKGWFGKTTDGANEGQVKNSYKDHMENCRQNDLAGIKKTGMLVKMVFAIVFGLIGLIILIAAESKALFVLPIIPAVIFMILTIKANSKIKATKAKINEDYDRMIQDGVKHLGIAIEQWKKLLGEKAAFESQGDVFLHLQ